MNNSTVGPQCLMPLFFLLMFFLLPFGNSVYFKLPSISPTSTDILYYEGDAVATVGAIDFNRVDHVCSIGRAVYSERVHIWDSATGILSDFTTHFTLVVNTRGNKFYGDGIAFFLAPVGFPIPPNSEGPNLGLFNSTTNATPAMNKIVYVEFDSFSNEEWDPPVEHVSINSDSLASLNWSFWNTSFHSGETANVWITYNGTSNNLSVYWTYELNPRFQRSSMSFISYIIDLKHVLPEWITVGFSAATGASPEQHSIKSWEFNSTLDRKKTRGSEERWNIPLVVALPAALLIIGIIVAWLILWMRWRAGRVGNKDGKNITWDFEMEAGPKKFIYKELAIATNNFSDNRKLGEGGFGGVYRGYLTELDLVVAVKKISRTSKQGKNEYVTEVKTISQLRHKNLVQLIGWCHDSGEFLLIYEYMPNGSLDSHLFGKRSPLSWGVRYNVALGLASGLLYLHEEWEQCVIHRDIKSSNVMLDSNFNTKLGDFGLARLRDHGLGPQTTGLAGTLGYLAPEYISTRKASKESDVFSFGVVALEIACGRKSSDPISEECPWGLVEWVWDLYGNEKLHEAVDETLCEKFDKNQVECLMMVGLWCAHPDHKMRPSVRQALQALLFDAMVPQLPPKMPVPLYLTAVPATSFSKPFGITTSLSVGR